MVDDGVEVPVESHEYPVIIGDSLLAQSDRDAGGNGQDEAAFALFQYKFTPASVDTTLPGLVSVDDSLTTTVLRGTTASSDGGITFKGKLLEQKDTECLLVFDGASFRLERCDFILAQLRPIRSAPATRVTANNSRASKVSTSSKQTSGGKAKAPAKASSREAAKPGRSMKTDFKSVAASAENTSAPQLAAEVSNQSTQPGSGEAVLTQAQSGHARASKKQKTL